MNIQLRQCFARAKPFRLKKKQNRKSEILSGFLISKKDNGVQKKPEFNSGFKKAKLATLINNSASSFLLIHIQANYIT